MADAMEIQFIWKKSCDTCRKVKKVIDSWEIEYVSREMNSQPLSVEDLQSIIGKGPIKPFLNTRNQVYRDLKLGQNPPELSDAIQLMAETNNLLKRPILTKGLERVIGNRIDDMARLVGREKP